MFFVLTSGAAPKHAAKSNGAATVSSGAKIYAQKCEICHFHATAQKKIGPGLAGEMKREKSANGWKATDANLRLMIERGGKNMPGFSGSLMPAQIRALIVYIRTL